MACGKCGAKKAAQKAKTSQATPKRAGYVKLQKATGYKKMTKKTA